MAEINIGKTENDQSSLSGSERSERLNDMESALRNFFNRLDNPNMSFNAEDAFDECLKRSMRKQKKIVCLIRNLMLCRIG